MIDGMTTVRRTITLDAWVDEQARHFAPDDNLSAFVNQLVEEEVRHLALLELIEKDERERGPISEEEVAEVGRRLDAAWE